MRTLNIAAAFLLYFNIAALPSLAQSPTHVVFIPGFAGSYLCEKTEKSPRVPVWPGSMDHSKIRLPMDVNLDPNSLRHEACGVVREAARLGGYRVSDVYGDFVDHLQKKLGERVKLHQFSYDWRLSVEHNAHQLLAYLDKNLTGRTVVIVAHSFGGLVARYFIKNLGGENRVRQLITMGTPHRGSADTFQTLYDGWGGSEGLQNKAVNWWLGGTAELRKSLLSFPGFYDMLPNFPNCCWFSPNTEFIAFDASSWSRFSFYKDHFPGSQEQAFLKHQLQRARGLHLKTLSVPLPGRHRREQVLIVTGYIDTITRVFVDSQTGERLPYERNKGDGTVPLYSAADARPIDDRALAWSPAVHMRIFNEQSARETVESIIIGGVAPTGGRRMTVRILARGDKWIDLHSLRYDVSPGAVGPGEMVRLTVRLGGDGALSTADISNLSAKTSTAAGEMELAFKSDENSPAEAGTRILIADFSAPNVPGAYIVHFNIPGLAKEHKDVFVVGKN